MNTVVRRRGARFIGSLSTLALLIGCSAPVGRTPLARSLEWIARYGYTEVEVVDFAFGEQGVWVPIVVASINDQPARLILDTGTRGYAALDDAGFDDLGVSIESWSTFLDSSGKPAGRIPRGRASSLALGTIRLTDIEIGGLGPESITGERLGYVGTLGWYALHEGRLTVDYANQKAAIAVGRLPRNMESCATRYVTPFVSPPDLDGLILIEGSLDGHKLLVQLDTGKSSTVLAPETSSIRSFARGPRGVEIGGLRIGPFELHTEFGRLGRGFDSFSRGMDLPVWVGVGSDVLARFLVTVDWVSRTVILEEAPC